MTLRRLAIIIAIAGGLLLVPLIANHTVEGFDWSAFDFAVMGGLLIIAGLAIDASVRRLRTPASRAAACGVVVLCFVGVWAELAVGAVSKLVAAIG